MPEPGPKQYTLAIFAAAVFGLAFGLGKIVRDCSLTCNVGYKLTPVAIIAIGLLAVPISSLTLKFATRMGYKRWQILSQVAIAFSFFVFWGAAALALLSSSPNAASHSRFIYLGFYIWLGALGAVIAPNIKSTSYLLFSSQDRAKALALTSAAVISGGLLGAFFAGKFANLLMTQFNLRYELARDSLIIVMGLVLLAGIPFIISIDRVTKSRSPDHKTNDTNLKKPATSSERTSLSNALRIILQDKKLKKMAALIFSSGIAETLLVFLFYWLVSEQIISSNGRTLFFADFYILLNSSTLIMLLIGANRLIDRFGLLFALLSIPLALVLGTAFLIMQSLVLVVYILKIVYSVLERSLYGQGVDRMILGIEERQSQEVRPILEGLMERVGQGFGAVLILMLITFTGITFSQMTFVYIGILLLWIYSIFSLRSQMTKPKSLSDHRRG